MAFVGRGQQSSVGFDPRSLGGLALWLDAADRSTLTLSGSNVTQWRDKSDVGNHTTSIVGTPTWSSNQVVLDGASVLIGPYVNTTTTLTAFVIASVNLTGVSSSAGVWRLLSLGTSNSYDFNSAAFVAILRDQGTSNIGGYRNSLATYVGVQTNTQFLLTQQYNGATAQSFLNGASSSSGNSTGSFNTARYAIGRDAMDAAPYPAFWVGTIREVLLYNSALTTAERQQVEGYLAAKWGLATPAGTHPWRYGPPVLLPTAISGCSLWLDAADATTLTLSGSNVTAWADKSGSGSNVSQATSSNQPTYSNSAVVFNGTSHFLTIPATRIPTGNSPWTYFFVVRPSAWSGTAAKVFFMTASTTDGLSSNLIFWIDGGPLWTINYQNNLVRGTTVPVAGRTDLLMFQYSQGQAIEGYVNGTREISPGVGSLSLSATYAYLGGNPGQGGWWFPGSLNEVIAYSNALTASQRQQIEGYLAWKWGLQSNLPTVQPALPATHPFRLAPPAVRDFSPLDVGDPSLWLDAADATTITLSGSNVTQWRDKSSNAFQFISASGQTPTVYGQTFNGTRPTVTATTTTSIMQSSGAISASTFATSSGITYFIVGIVTGGYLLTKFFDGTARVVSMEVGSQLRSDYNTTMVQTTSNVSVPFLATVQYDGASTAFRIFYNGTLAASSNVVAPSYSFSAILALFGQVTATPDFGGSGSLCEFLIYPASLTTTQRERIETYLAAKWGLRASLGEPSHPYRYGAPLGILPISAPAGGLALWLDAADTTTLTLSGSNVTQWNDKSGSSNHMVLNTNNVTNPTYSAATGVSFSNSVMHTNRGIQTMCAFAVYAQSDTGAILSGTTSAAGTSRIYFGIWQGSRNLYNVPTADGTVTINNNTSFSSSALFVGSYIFDGSNVTAFANGTSTSNTAFTGTPGISTNVILGADVFNGNYDRKVFSMRELLLFTTPVTAVQRQQIEGYLASKWNLNSNLPSDHLYKVVPLASIPTAAPGCVIWLDAADQSTLTLSGSNVTQWRDKSGSSNHFNTVSGTPTYSSNKLTFVANTLMQSTSTISLTTNHYAYVVHKNGTTTATSMIISFPNISPGGYSGDFSIRLYDGILAGSGTYSPNEGDFGGTTYYVNGSYRPTFGTSVYSSINIISGQSSKNATTSVAVSSIFGGRTFVGDIYEFILYSSPPSTAQRQQIEGYLAAKWGITAVLPATHPYTTRVPGAPATSPPVPATVPGLSLWLDGADSTTLFQDTSGATPVTTTGQTVRRWNDKSGRGCNATQSGGAPVWNSAGYTTFTRGNFETLRLPDGTLPYSAATNSYSLFAVMRPNASGGNRTILSSGSAGNNQFNALQIADNGTLSNLWYNNDLGGGSVPLNAFSIASATYNGTTRTVFVTGTTVATGNSTSWAGTLSNNVIGLESATNNHPFGGDIAEVMVYPAALTTTQRQLIEGYLAWKWGASLRLPSSANALAKLYRPVTAVFTPTQIAGLSLWLDAADRTTLTLSGSNVTQWRDKSGSGYTASAVGTVTTTTQNGNTAIDFAGTGSFNVSNYAWNTYSTTFWVGRDFAILAHGSTSTSYSNYIFPGNWYLSYIRDSGGVLELRDSVLSVGTTVTPSNVYYMFSWGYGGGTAASPYNVNGEGRSTTVQAGSGRSNSTITALLQINGNFFNSGTGQFCELLMYNSVLTQAQARQVEGYLSWKWGLLPSLGGTTHPFRTGPLTNFVPASTPVGGCTFWLDAADVTTFTLSGSNVTQWRDKINGVPMTTQGTLSNITRTQTGINGRPSVYLNNAASDSVYMSGTLSNQTTGTAFYVVKAYSQRTVSWRPFLTWFNDAQFPAYGYLGNTTVNTVGPYTTSASPNGTPTQVLTPSGTYMISYGWTGTTTTVTTNGSAAQAGSQQTYSSSGTSLWLGADGTGASERITLEYGEIMLFNRVLSTIDRQEVEGYLAAKWNLTSTLPIGYPYSIGATSVPASLPGLALWLDATDLTSLSLSGTSVTGVRDKSSNSIAMTVSGTRPGYLTTFTNGLPGFAFTGSQWIRGSFPSTYTGSTLTVFAVATLNPATALNARLVSLSTGTLTDFQGSTRLGGALMRYITNEAIGTYRAGVTDANASVTYNTPTLMASEYTNTTFTLYTNGTSRSTSAASSPFEIGTVGIGYLADYGGTNDGAYWYGNVGEVLIFFGTLTAAQRQRVEGYLAAKWGLTPGLPSIHPFKTSAPTVVAPTFVPESIAGLSMWLDAADATTLTLSGSNVTAWRDKTGLNTSSTIVGTPTRITSALLNNLPAIRFSGSTVSLAYSGFSLPQPFTVFAVTVQRAAVGISGYSFVVETTRSDGAGAVILYNNSNLVFYAGSDVNPSPAVTYSSNITGIYSGVFNGGSSFLAFNGRGTSNQNPGTLGWQGLYLGRDWYGYYQDQDVAEVLFYSSALSTAQRQQVEGYLASKWNLGSNMPIDHPYKLVAPGAIPPTLVPTAISGCRLWLDAADTTTLTLSGSNVTAWADKSGLGNHYIQATTSNQPVYITDSVYARPCLSFNGTGAFLTQSNASQNVISNSSAFSIFTVHRINSGNGIYTVYRATPNTSPWFRWQQSFGEFSSGGFAGGSIIFASNAIAGVQGVSSFVADSGSYAGYINGNLMGSKTRNSGTTNLTFAIGRGDTTYGEFLSGSIFEILMFDRRVTTAERQQIEGYLAWKWGFQTNLPNGSHPYKSFKP